MKRNNQEAVAGRRPCNNKIFSTEAAEVQCVPDNLRGAPLSRVLEKRNRRKKMGV